MTGTQVRQNQRYYFQDKDRFLVKIEMNAEGKFVECILSDVSVSGVCIIVDKQIFLARDKEYSMEILEKRSDGNFASVANAKGKIIWYLTKEFRNQDMMFLGIQFQNTISLPKSIISEEEVSI